MTFISAGYTNIGKERKINQDSIYVNQQENLYIVADGMGAHRGGDTASTMAVELIPKKLFENKTIDPKENLHNSIQFANQSIFDKSKEDVTLRGMGTTLVSVYRNDDTVYISNIGDSRTYLIHEDQIFQLTKDHSLVQEKINQSIYSREEAAADPQKNVLIKSLGYEENPEIDIYTYNFKKNDILLLSSDGLHGLVSDADINHIIQTYSPDADKTTEKELETIAHALIDQANNNGGKDNISVIMLLCR